MEGQSPPDGLPDGWADVQLLRTLIALCPQCRERIEEPRLTEALVSVLRDHLVLMPHVGDEVILLVDGCRGKFKGRNGVVNGVGPGDSYGIRVPGEIAPGETEEYVGPYLRRQFRLIRGQP